MNIKWGKEKFEKVELDTDETPEVFKAQLFALSGVSPDRQKVMLKGAVFKVTLYFIPILVYSQGANYHNIRADRTQKLTKADCHTQNL